MTEKIKLVQGDTRPQIKVNLTDENTGNVIDLTSCTCVMKFRAVGSTTVLDTLVGTVTNGVAGEVVFPWGATTLSVEAGDYEGEIEITFPSGGGVQSVYELLKFKVREDF